MTILPDVKLVELSRDSRIKDSRYVDSVNLRHSRTGR